MAVSEGEIIYCDRVEDSYAALAAVQTLRENLDRGEQVIQRYRPFLTVLAWMQRAVGS